MALGKGSHQKGLRRAALLLGDLPQALQGSLASRKKKKRPPNHRRCHVCLSFFEEPCLAGEPFIRETNKDGRRALVSNPPPPPNANASHSRLPAALSEIFATKASISAFSSAMASQRHFSGFNPPKWVRSPLL